MSRTRRRIPRSNFRLPKRNIQGKDFDEVRVGAIPPHSYDDLHFCKESIGAYPFMREMISRGMGSEKLIKTIRSRYRVSMNEAHALMDFIRRYP